jgi:tRNA pseudouridine55 synthase
MHGILLVDKPEGMTSSDVVGVVKRRVKPAKVGHSGTLDPAATGLLVVLIGAGTRTLDYLDENRKSYWMLLKLGEETDTDDRDGKVIHTADASALTIPRIEEALGSYRGVIDQVPPRYSAIKREGEPLYRLARKGVFPELAPRKVEIFSLILKGWQPPFLELEMVSSKGTYARALARDLGRDLGVGGRLEALRRTGSGRFKIEDAAPLAEISEGGAPVITSRLISLADALTHIPDLRVASPEATRLMRGGTIVLAASRLLSPACPRDHVPRLLKIVSASGDLLMLVRPEPSGTEIAIRPVRVFNTWRDG